MVIDPLTRLSKHFIVGDFLRNHTTLTKGLGNTVEGTEADVAKRLQNAVALCDLALEPILEEFGPLSVSHGYMAPAVSKACVHYQDPDKPSHHRWDLGAAADICVHRWVEEAPGVGPNSQGAPILLAHAIDQLKVPYSRLITYSESPYLCLAVSYTETEQDHPRKAFYENRYEGRPRARPKYITYASDSARRKGYDSLLQLDLGHNWRGAGYPTSHGGGIVQYQHTRVSKYTMLLDWFGDLQSIAIGAKNIPALGLDSIQDALGAAGLFYDLLVDETEVPRLSILSGYLSHTNPEFNENNDWRTGIVTIKLLPPEGEDLVRMEQVAARAGAAYERDEDGGMWFSFESGTMYDFCAQRGSPVVATIGE